jgi:hypothetical protein
MCPAPAIADTKAVFMQLSRDVLRRLKTFSSEAMWRVALAGWMDDSGAGRRKDDEEAWPTLEPVGA